MLIKIIKINIIYFINHQKIIININYQIDKYFIYY